MESMWNVSMRILHGFHVDFIWNPYLFHVNSMDSTWNKSVPHGFHVECGGMVKYWSMGRTRLPTKSMQVQAQVLFPKRVTDHDLSEPRTRDTGEL
jgi:hypothetical protein